LPEPITGYRGSPPVKLWPDDMEMQQKLLALVRGGVDVYGNVKLTQAEATVQVRFNTEFEPLGEGNSMMGLRNWGEFLNRTMADFSFYADNALARWEPVSRWVDELRRYDLLSEDKFGPSSSIHVRAGDVEINGEDHSLSNLIGARINDPIPAVAALRRARLRAVNTHHIN
ncbi:MAG: hypothetical protein AAF499_09840, partial [Pseudomonadota bacterium]